MKSRYPTYGEFLNESNDPIEENKFSTWTKKMFKKGTDFSKSVWAGTKRESKETQRALQILKRMAQGQNATDDEKKFLKAQSGDLIKIVPLIAIQGVPGAIPITSFLVMLGKKYGFNILPNSHDKISLDDLDKDK